MNDRTHRFLIPPVLLIAYWATGIALADRNDSEFLARAISNTTILFSPKVDKDPNSVDKRSQPDSPRTAPDEKFGASAAHLAAAVFAGSVILIALGIVMGTITTLFLKLVDWAGCYCCKHTLADANFIKNLDEAKIVLTKIGYDGAFPPPEFNRCVLPLMTSHIFIHAICPTNLWGFFDRRWNTYIVSCNCISAGMMAMVGSRFLFQKPPCAWYTTITILSMAFAIVGISARADLNKVFYMVFRSKHLKFNLESDSDDD